MGKYIGSKMPDNYGERIFIEKSKEYLEDDCIIYWNRQVFGKEFDVCILIPDQAILVVELKGWKESNIKQVENGDTIVVQTEEGPISANPMRQSKGYRFAIERRVKQDINKFPLVVSMVSLPQVSKSFFSEKELEKVCEGSFTLLKEDLSSKRAFNDKINQALAPLKNWDRDSFDAKTMFEVRNLFETDIKLIEDTQTTDLEPLSYHDYDYSYFCYIKKGDLNKYKEKLIDGYLKGTKIYSVLEEPSEYYSVIAELKSALSKKGLKLKGYNIEIDFQTGEKEAPKVNKDSFVCFNLSLSTLKRALDEKVESFELVNGGLPQEKKAILRALSANSSFNMEQYEVEHAEADKNIIIRAGAGTGKTHTMIARIAYIAYTQKTTIETMKDRIVMITFTNEAAEQMKEKLKIHFRNFFLLTSRREYLSMISLIAYMKISTIHSYAKELIELLGSEFGYGVDISILSSEYSRRRTITSILDSYISTQKKLHGDQYLEELGHPIYAIRDYILSFIAKLHNKSVDVSHLSAESFGKSKEDANAKLHELFSQVIPEVERVYSEELLDDNKVHLSTMMSKINKFLSKPESQERIRELRKVHPQFLFVDEFQDTDDIQIDTLLKIAELLDYRLFVVGDIKQCIYRFRGAKEKSFDQLPVRKNPRQWQEFSLRINYRTDVRLLELFDKSFSSWGESHDKLLTYNGDRDRLIGVRNYNSLSEAEEKFYKHIPIVKEEERLAQLIGEIRRLRSRIADEEAKGRHYSQKEKTIAILVRENWQAELVKKACANENIMVQTNTGGDLYMAQPAIDMLTLVNALLHFDEALYLYSFFTSNFFNLDINKSHFYSIRQKIKRGSWREEAAEKEMLDFIIENMNASLVSLPRPYNTWEEIVASLRMEPVLQVMRLIYSSLKPWENYSSDPWKQSYYRLNVDLLFEQLINSCNTDSLTISTLQDQLYNSIIAKVSVDSRLPDNEGEEGLIQCITVHKSKGLEYGFVILPFCSFDISNIRNKQLQVTTVKDSSKSPHIGYRLHPIEKNKENNDKAIENDIYDEKAEASEREREETRILYVAMTRAMISFSWIDLVRNNCSSWQQLIEQIGVEDHAI